MWEHIHNSTYNSGEFFELEGFSFFFFFFVSTSFSHSPYQELSFSPLLRVLLLKIFCANHSKLSYLSIWNELIHGPPFSLKRLASLRKLFLLSDESGLPLTFSSLCYQLHIWHLVQGRNSMLSTMRRKKHKALRSLGSLLLSYWKHTLVYLKRFRLLKMRCKNVLS